MNTDSEKVRYTVSMVRQNKYRFFALTMPTDVLARCCFATTREEDPMQGFQRVFDRKRAQEIADYIDSGMGTIPSSIILSAQPEAEIEVVGRGRTISITLNKKAFLILDGQHRVYGYSLARSEMRVPVVIYDGLTRRDETRLFIDINSKQKGVPSELLLDIKHLADIEDEKEQALRILFNEFHSRPSSVLIGLTSPSSKAPGKLSRNTFNLAFKGVWRTFANRSEEDIYTIANNYLTAVDSILFSKPADHLSLVNPTIFRAFVAFLPRAANQVKDRFGEAFSADNFSEVLTPILVKIKKAKIQKPGNSYIVLLDHINECYSDSILI